MAGKKPKILLNDNALRILKERYLLKNDRGKVSEKPQEMLWRVAQAVSRAEKKARPLWRERFFELMATGRFLPNSPTLMNAGTARGQLSACFVLPIEDSLESIFGTLGDAAKIHQSGGGTGFSFSKIRAQGSRVRSAHGVASGPISFLKIYDVATETIRQGGARRGANMAVLRVDHPDVLSFVDCKRDQRSILNFNLSVGVTERFMNAVKRERKFELRDPRTGKVARRLPAKEIFDRIVQAAWECGDPGLVFLDKINLFNPTPQLGPIESTNPCGEQPLLPYESCNLGSLNLGAYVSEQSLDWKLLEQDVWTAVRFLDDVIDINEFPSEKSEQISRKNRKIGLGVMGFADALLMLGVPYDSEEAFRLGEQWMSFIDQEAKAASMALAREKGAFANWKGSRWQKRGYSKMRNAAVTTVAPTGTISILAGASSGIEPIFSSVYYRNILGGKRLKEVHPALERLLVNRGVKTEDINDDEVAKVLGSVWRPAAKVSVEDHVRMQAVFQRHTDSAVSKTINLPEWAPKEDVAKAYLLAWEWGCKGITVYRDRSRLTQVLERAAPAVPAGEMCPTC